MTEVTHMTQTPEYRWTPDSDPERSPKPAVAPQAVSLEDAARLLSRAGGRLVTLDVLPGDVDGGALANPDGSLNQVHGAAWLVKKMGRGD